MAGEGGKEEDDPLLAGSDGSASSDGQDHNAESGGTIRELTIDEMLQQGVGEFGWAQQRHFFLVNLAWVSEALQTLLMVFAEKTPQWQCTEPSSLAPAPLVPCTSAADLCMLRTDQWEWTDHRESTMAEFGLICGQAWKAGLVGSLFFLGFLFGAGIFGTLSDGFLGRKKALFACTLVVALAGGLTGMAPSYWLYAVARLLVGVGAGGLGLVAFVLGSEPVGPKYRGEVGLATQYFFSAGVMLLSLAAYLVPHWRRLAGLVSLPSALFLLLWGAIDESPRWLLVRSKVHQAMAVLRKMAHRNGTSLPAGAVLRTVAVLELDTSQPGDLRGTDSDLAPGGEARTGEPGGSEWGGDCGKKAEGRDVRRSKAWEIFRVGITRKWMLVCLVNW